MSQVQQIKRVIEQLRKELALKRIPVSQALQDIEVRMLHITCCTLILIIMYFSLLINLFLFSSL